MTGRQRKHRMISLAVMAGLCLVLPSAITLLAEEKAPAKPAATAPAAKPAATQAKTKEQKEAEEIARVMEFFKQTQQPDAYDKILRLRDTDPVKFKALIKPEVVNRVNSLAELKKSDPEYYDLKIKDYQLIFQSESLAEQLHRADLAPADRDKIMAELTDLVSRRFDNAQEMQRKDIANTEERIKKLQAALEEREKNKEKIIKRKLNELAPPSPTTAPVTAQKNP